MSIGPVKHYPDIIFETFEDARNAREFLYSYTWSGAVTVDFFIKALDHIFVNFKVVDNTGTEDSILYGWVKRGNLAIYEYEYEGKIYYIFEDPVPLFKIIVP